MAAADSNSVVLPADVAAHFADAIRAVRAAQLVVRPWLASQPPATQLVVGRALNTWMRAIGITEPLVVAAQE